jgi:hypothetical protein
VAAQLDASRPHPWRAELGGAVLAAGIALALAAWSLHLWSWHPSLPFAYSSDAFYYEGVVKGTLEHGWYLHNPDLGAPFGLDSHDFPVVGNDSLQLLIVKAIGLFTDRPFVVTNIFYLLTFPLTGASTFVALRWRRVRWSLAVAGGAIFAIAPFHFLHGVVHLFFASYYLVPLACALVLAVLADEPLIERRAGVTGPQAWISWRAGGLVLLCAGIASASIYYALFALLLLGAAGLGRGILSASRRALVSGFGLAALIAVFAVANQIPNLLYKRAHGPNPLAAERAAADSEVYGSKLIQLVLPVPGHRIGPLGDLTKRYLGTSGNLGEPLTMLGLVATVGFLWLLAVAVLSVATPGRRKIGTAEERNAAFAVLVAFLFSTSSGFSTVMAYVLTPQFRSWGRIAIYIGFFSLLASLLLLERLIDRLPLDLHRLAPAPALAVLVVVAALDQVSPAFTPNAKAIEAAVTNDSNFTQELEWRMPRGSMVLQLPYSAYPENAPIQRLRDYDELRPYLHSTHLRFSYAAIKGRPDDWHATASTYPLRALVAGSSAAGFAGIIVDRFGYADRGAALEAELGALLGAPTVVAGDRRLAFWDLAPVKAQIDSAEQARLGPGFLHPVTTTWVKGAGGAETDGIKRWRWLHARATVQIDNPASTTARVRLRAGLRSGSGASVVTIRLPDGSVQTRDAGPEEAQVRLVVDVPPGRSQVTLDTAGEPVPLDVDARGLFLQVIDLRLVPEDLCTKADQLRPPPAAAAECQ